MFAKNLASQSLDNNKAIITIHSRATYLTLFSINISDTLKKHKILKEITFLSSTKIELNFTQNLLSFELKRCSLFAELPFRSIKACSLKYFQVPFLNAAV